MERLEGGTRVQVGVWGSGDGTMVLLHVTAAGVRPLSKLYSLLLDNLCLCFVISMMA